MSLFERLPPINPESGCRHVVIDTPKGSRNKYSYDFARQVYRLAGMLPAGAYFPFDFGSVPGTTADDDDPLDVLVLMDEPTFCGCLVEARVLGVIEARQTEKGQTKRNDRLIAVAAETHLHAKTKSLGDLAPNLLAEIEHFFVSYNEGRGKRFKPIGRKGPRDALALVRKLTRPD